MKTRILTLLAVVATMGLTACASNNDTSVGRFKVGKPYSIKGQTYYPEENYTFTETGLASWYGPGFHGKKTANGERFDEDAFTAAHKTLQMPSLVRVTNLENGRSVVVRVTDRGPFHGNRIIDVSKGAAIALDFYRQGTARVKIQVLGPESMALSAAARNKIDTRDAEVAVNRTGMLDERFAAFYPQEYMPEVPQASVMVASNDTYPTMDAAVETVRPAYKPVPSIEQAVAWNPQPQPTVPVSSGLSAEPVVTAQGTPLPPSLPEQRRDQVAYVRSAMAAPRAPVPPEHPPIPVARLEPADMHIEPAAYHPAPQLTYFVQTGAYTSPAMAQRAAQLVAAYGPNEIVSAQLGGRPYYRLRIGPFESVEKADALVDTLKRQGRQAFTVVTKN